MVRWLLYLRHDIAVQTYLGRLQPFGNTLKTPTNPRNSAFGKDPRNAIRKETDQRINREAVESTAHVTSQGFMFNCLPAKRLSLCGPGYDTRSQDQFLFPAMATRPANHPVNISGAFQAIADLTFHISPNAMYSAGINTDWTSVVGSGYVKERREVETNGGDGEAQLEVIVGHDDWDSHNRCHKAFKVKYIVPGSKNMVKTHVLYAVGREMQIVGHLVDWDVDMQMAVVLVKSVSLANGHQNPCLASQLSPSGATPGKNGRTFYKFGNKPVTPVTPGRSVVGTSDAGSPLEGKGKAQEPEETDKAKDILEAEGDKENSSSGTSKPNEDPLQKVKDKVIWELG
ncbi:hypothetical protein MJO29_012885 [Puccinia striiformis f. sp. tritici]|nr:hypothetical protein MJO29_012885 [Puccinia striiformis f. sp. tritici]